MSTPLDTTPQQFAALAAASIPGVTAAAFLAGYANDDLNEAARISWTYSCSRYNTGARRRRGGGRCGCAWRWGPGALPPTARSRRRRHPAPAPQARRPFT